MVTQCDWSWYFDVGSSLITCYNKSKRAAVYHYDSAHCIEQRRHITHTDWLCIVGRDYNKNQNFCGDESISREIGSTQKRISWNRVNTKTKSGEIWSMRDFRFIMNYVSAYLYWPGSVPAATATVECSRCRLPRHSSHIQTAAAIAVRSCPVFRS